LLPARWHEREAASDLSISPRVFSIFGFFDREVFFMARKSQGPWFWEYAGWWVVQIRGERVKFARGRENEKAAIKRYHEVMASLPTSPDAPNVDVASLFEAYLQWAEENHSPETYRGYKFYLQCFVDAFGHRQVRSLRLSDADGWLKKKRTWNASLLTHPQPYAEQRSFHHGRIRPDFGNTDSGVLLAFIFGRIKRHDA
jgi:hypothetical protein